MDVAVMVYRQILWSFEMPEASPLKILRVSPNEMDRNESPEKNVKSCEGDRGRG